LKAFRRLISQFPKDPYAKKARSHIHQCQKILAGNEFYVGYFYYKDRHYPAAIGRFKAVIEKYPDVGVQYKALRYLARCKKELLQQGQEEEAGDQEE
jgi:outer membrane protein assembly factor BamD